MFENIEWEWGLSTAEESRIRYHARRLGFQVASVRVRELRRRRSHGLGDLMLIDTNADRVALFVSTFREVAEFLEAHTKRPPLGENVVPFRKVRKTPRWPPAL
jgi:hypothetical protein